MNTGIPGTGLATIFYVLSTIMMPVYELVRMARGLKTSLGRWRLIFRHFLVSVAMFAMFYGTFSYLPAVRIGSLLIKSQYLAIGITLSLLVIIIALLPRLRGAASPRGSD